MKGNNVSMALDSVAEYLEKLSAIGETLFQEQLSDRTVKRQNILLLVSVISILIAVSILKPVNGSALGIKLTLTNISHAKYILGIFCIYFLLIYLFSVAHDFTLFKYRRLQALSIMNQLLEENQKSVQKRIERILSHSKELDKIFEEQWELISERDNLSNKYSKKIERLRNEFYSASIKKNYHKATALFNATEELLREEERDLKPYDDLIDEMDNDQRITQLRDQIDTAGAEDSEALRSEDLFKVLKRFKVLQFTKSIVEIVVPTFLSLVAILLSFK